MTAIKSNSRKTGTKNTIWPQNPPIWWSNISSNCSNPSSAPWLPPRNRFLCCRRISSYLTTWSPPISWLKWSGPTPTATKDLLGKVGLRKLLRARLSRSTWICTTRLWTGSSRLCSRSILSHLGGRLLRGTIWLSCDFIINIENINIYKEWAQKEKCGLSM